MNDAYYKNLKPQKLIKFSFSLCFTRVGCKKERLINTLLTFIMTLIQILKF